MAQHIRVTKLLLVTAAALIVWVGVLSAQGAMAQPDAAEAAETAADPWATAEGQGAAAEGSEDRVIGRVVGLRGRVYAQTPGEEKRLLVENAPIFPGDRIVTSSGAQIGVLSGEYYTGLSEDTTLVYSKHGNGAPEVRLEHGDVRVINAGDGENAQIETPGMVAAAASSDTAAYAVKEKAWVVSLVCALEGQVKVAGPGQQLTVDEGGCAASQPAAGLFAAGSAPAALPVASPPPVGAAGPAGAATTAAARFSDPVDGPPGADSLLTMSADLPIEGSDPDLDLIQPCDNAAVCAAAALGAGPGPVPPQPPVGLNLNGLAGGNLRGNP